MAGEVLADVNGQGISSTLREGRTQLSLLDDVAGTAAAAKVFTETWDRMQHLQAKVHSPRPVGLNAHPIPMAMLLSFAP